MLIRKRLVAVATASLLIGSAAFAQDQWEEQVQAQLVNYSESLSEQGYTLTDVTTEYELNDGDSDDFWIELSGGVEYGILGVCDNDCSDVDLEIFDSESNSMDSDYEVDDYPVLTLIPKKTRRFRIHVYMADCNIEPCSWGVGVYER